MPEVNGSRNTSMDSAQHFKRHSELSSAAWVTAMLFLAVFPALHSQDILPDEQRTNGAETLKVTVDLQKRAAASGVQLGRQRDRTIAGVILTADGYLLTQSSDSKPLAPLRAFLPDGSECETREVKRSDSLNLVLLKIERTGLQPIAWGDSQSLQQGQWLTSLARQGREVRLGVVSARRRPIPNSGAVLGVRFGADDDDAGVVVEEVGEDSPAQKAGLLADDLILTVNGVKVISNADLKRLIAARRPGDQVTLRFSRQGKEMESRVSLASTNQVQRNWEGEDFANHGTSLRTDNFPGVIQHDMPLSPADMGGAVYDLQGRAVALNIARVDRVTNYALPADLFLSEVMRWVKEDEERTVKRPAAAE